MNLPLPFLAACLGFLTLPACMCTGAVTRWAFDARMSAEVHGFVEGGAQADALLVEMRRAEFLPDGLYEVPLESDSPSVALDLPRPRRLTAAEAASWHAARGKSRRVGDLERAAHAWPTTLEHVDAFERTATGYRRIPAAEGRYLVGAEPRSVPTEPPLPLKVRILWRPPEHGRLRTLGVVHLPAQRKHAGRALAGAFAVPVTLVIDVVTSPVQFVVGMRQLGEGLGRLFEELRALSLVSPGLFVGRYLPLPAEHLPAMHAVAPASPALLVLTGYAVLNRAILPRMAGDGHPGTPQKRPGGPRQGRFQAAQVGRL